MADAHDNLYKQLFSHPEMVRELLRGFVPQAWAQRVEVDALDRVNASYVGERGSQRHDDLVWRVRIDGDWMYVYLLLELQARPDRWMALRMQVYVGLLCQDLLRQRRLTRGGKLPPVLPVVLYHGTRPWRAPTEMTRLMLPAPDGLQPLQPQQRYLLIDGTAAGNDVGTGGNLVAALFHLVHARDRLAVEQALARFIEHMQNPAMRHVKQSLLRWMDFVLNAKAFETMVEMDSDGEAEMLKPIDRKWRDLKDFQEWQAHQMGLEKGLEQGRVQGARQLLLDWMANAGLPRSGPIEARINGAAAEQIAHWLVLLAQGRSVDQVFAVDAAPGGH